jgi:VWFA-related protein
MRSSVPSRVFLGRRSFLTSAVAAWPALSLLRAQDREATFKSDVRVVNIFATVRDKQGHIVSELAKDDFTVTEDGRPQTIRYFSRETDLPLTLGLLVDTSLSQRRVLGQEKTASYAFLDKVLRADRDKTFVIHFDHESELLQDLTASRVDLQRALDQLQLPADGQPQLSRGTGPGGNPGGNSGAGGGYPGGGGGIGFPGGGIGFPGGMGRRGGGGRQQGGQRRSSGPGTTLYDAIYLASNEIMKKQQGRKAIILLTDGVDNGSKTFLSDAIEAAQRADTLAYSILFSDEQAYGQQSGFGVGRRGGGGGEQADGKKVLERISKETGGSFFEVSKKLSIDDIYDRIQEELRNQYSIGYSPDRSQDESTGYRAIKVTVKDSKMVVQTREGYYPPPDPSPRAQR